MQERSTILKLIIILTFVATGAMLVAIAALYKTAINGQRERLIENTQNRARLLESIARFDVLHSADDHPNGSLGATLSQIIDAHIHSKGFGETGEFQLAKREEDQIVFVLRHRYGKLHESESVPFFSEIAEPMRRALSGLSGTIIGLDFQGTEVLAAYEPVAELNMGVVTKIDMAEIRAPFIKAGLFSIACAMILVLVGTLGIIRVTNPIISRLRLQTEDLKHEVENRIKTEAVIQESKTNLAQAQTLAKVGSWRLDLPGGTLVWSDETYRIFGLQIGEPISYEKFLNCIHPDDREAVDQAWKAALAKKTYDIEHRILVDGKTKWVRELAELEFSNNNEIIQGIGTVADITDRKLAAAEKSRLEGQLYQSQKMDAIGRLAGGVAHDFNNLLTAIQGYADVIDESIPSHDPLHEDIQQIIRASESAASLTQQLLAFSRKQIISPVVLDLNKVVTNSEKMLRRILGEDLDLFWVPSKEISRIRADAGQIDQVLVNLAVNARDALSEGGKLTIETQNVFLENKPCQSCDKTISGQYVMMAVSDNGIGMDDATLKKVFEPFFTTKGKGKGTGLGLATVHGIVHQNNGHIHVYSEPNEGTSFKIYWPAVDEEIVEEVSPQTIEAQICTETILLVEDQSMVRDLVKRALERRGYTVLQAVNGEEALDRYQNCEETIDLLFTDVVMPKMNGRQLYNELSKKIPNLKVLYMSGYTENAIAHHGVLDKDVHYLQKPFKESVLTAKVRKALDNP